ncbi:hypothetical protein BsIDN1_55290 [Bacillus safensis]|uniref:Uncharacterized protein n=1 Tax=Bacillus safensis TaxID=561879 RepID=A0A5S9MG19_BACIA|nr:hypothetical protein BsIDN1_55290 [Bacillus safensis]
MPLCCKEVKQGGHRGTFLHAKGDALVGLISLISDVKPLCRVPLIAAGGITNRLGMKAALALESGCGSNRHTIF